MVSRAGSTALEVTGRLAGQLTGDDAGGAREVYTRVSVPRGALVPVLMRQHTGVGVSDCSWTGGVESRACVNAVVAQLATTAWSPLSVRGEGCGTGTGGAPWSWATHRPTAPDAGMPRVAHAAEVVCQRGPTSTMRKISASPSSRPMTGRSKAEVAHTRRATSSSRLYRVFTLADSRSESGTQV